MATTDYDFNLTRNEIIQDAFQIIGAISLGETLTANQIDQGVKRLNSLLKSWQNKHVFLHAQQLQTQALASGDADYTLGNEVKSIVQAYYTDSGYDQDVNIISYPEYLKIPDKDVPGDPVVCALNYTPQARVLYVYPVPTGSLTLSYLAEVRLQDADSASGNIDIPQEYLDALTYGLAARLVDRYSIPLGEKQMIKREAEQLFQELKTSEHDYEDVTFVASAFRPDRIKRR